MHKTTFTKFLKSVTGIFGFIISMTIPIYASNYIPNSDITAQLNADIAAGANGPGPNRAVITLPGGSFSLSASINLHGSTLRGAGWQKTAINLTTDLGPGTSAFTGDAANTY